MNTSVFVVAVTLAAEGLTANVMTRDEIDMLPFMTALAYAEAIDAYCLPQWHYASLALTTAATMQADLRNKSHLGIEPTRDASRLQSDRSACVPAMAFVDKVTGTIPDLQPRMEATLAALEQDETRRSADRARADRIDQ